MRTDRSPETVRLLVSLLGLALGLAAACQKEPAGQPAPETTAVETTPVPPPPPAPAAGPPPERYATLPPGAFGDDPAASTPEGTAAGSAPGTSQRDPGLVPNAGELNLTGVRIGMNLAEVHGRYTPDSGWESDTRFAAGTETGVVLAKPRDARARAAEMFMLQDGIVVAFLRTVQEDGEAFKATAQELAASYGAPGRIPPEWALTSALFSSWRTTANEEARFWNDPHKRIVLTAGHSPNDAETVYMLVDPRRTEEVRESMTTAGQAVPDADKALNPPAPSAHQPPAAGAHG